MPPLFSAQLGFASPRFCIETENWNTRKIYCQITRDFPFWVIAAKHFLKSGKCRGRRHNQHAHCKDVECCWFTSQTDIFWRPQVFFHKKVPKSYNVLRNSHFCISFLVNRCKLIQTAWRHHSDFVHNPAKNEVFCLSSAVLPSMSLQSIVITGFFHSKTIKQTYKETIP